MVGAGVGLTIVSTVGVGSGLTFIHFKSRKGFSCPRERRHVTKLD